MQQNHLLSKENNLPKLVSVVIPNYNCAQYLDRCLESVVSQTYTHLEIIICDNGSHDNSVAILQQWAAKDVRIKLLINEQNQGLVKCYNRMFFEATGDYICILDADDWSDVTRIEKQVKAIEEKRVDFCLTNSLFYYGNYDVPEMNHDGMSKPINIFSKELWAPATIMFKREILKEVPGYHLYFDRITSYDNYFILDLLDRYQGYYLSDCLYFVQARSNSDHRSLDVTEPNFLRKVISHEIYEELKRQRQKTKTDWLKDNDLEKLKAFENQLLNNKDYMADKVRTFACIQLDYGNREEAKKLLKEALKLSPLLKSNYRTLLYYIRTKWRKSILTEAETTAS